MKKSTSIRTQLAVIILSVTLMSTFLAFSFSLIYDYRTSRDDFRNSMRFTASQFAENCKSPLLFGDTRGAQELLASFKTIPTVRSAVIYTVNDSPFAAYPGTAAGQTRPSVTGTAESVRFIGDELTLSLPVIQNGQAFGRFEMNVSTHHLNSKLCINAAIFAGVFLLIIAISYVLAMRLQRIISRPVLDLKKAAEHITSHADYSIRIPLTCDNEIGQLQTSFDDMVRQLEKTISALKAEIDTRIRAQDEAQHLRAYLQNTIDAISLAIIAVDRDGCIRLMNSEALRFIGKDHNELYGNPAIEAVTALTGHAVSIIAALKDNASREFQATEVHPVTLQQTFFRVALFPLSDREREGAVLVIEDITEKTRMETMMIQSEKMLSLGGLAAGMAHEINNPLGIISLGVQNILGHLAPDNSRNRELANEAGLDTDRLFTYLTGRKINHYLDGMQKASKRASDIVANMLQFSRTAPGSKSPVNIAELIDQTVLLAQNEFELKKKYDFGRIRIVREFDPHLPGLVCNATEIQQVLLNLFKNAAHALFDKCSEDGDEPRITIRLRNGHQHVRIEIDDNGPGIPEKTRSRIFEPFFTTKEVGVGTGLGLSVSYFIITKNHAGTIEFTSEEGKGTCFIITLPAK